MASLSASSAAAGERSDRPSVSTSSVVSPSLHDGRRSSSSSPPSSSSAGRLLIVANRLPVSMSIKQRADGAKSDIHFTSSAGGLVSALAGTDMESFWIGWPGGEVKSKEDRQVVGDKLLALGSIPVFLTNEVCDLFYNGFCNDLLWPLFHYIPLPIDAIKAHDRQFSAYQKANAEFAKVVLEQFRDGDTVWVHDYHLMLLPSLLRQARPQMKIGFFFHTPFPSSEIYRVIPSRNELLYGVLSANLLGFHTHDYSRHFQSAATRILGAQCGNEQVSLNEAVSTLGTFPIGIDPKRFVEALTTEAVQRHLAEFKRQFAGKRVLLGIDRLDYIKGIPHKLHALELFFDRNPQFVGEVVLVQIAIPSRTDVVEYQRLKTSTHELVGRINGRFGSVSSVPIHYLDQSIPFDKMCALYRVSDSMVITSIRDGMNLVAYEYIACQHGSNGVLILSEFAGAAQSLGAGALQVNPWNISEVADAIHKALTMPEKERKERTDYCFHHVMTHTARAWAREFVEVLERIPVAGGESSSSVNGSASSSSLSSIGSESNNQMKASLPSPLDADQLIASFSQSKHRLIITGLAGIVSRAAALREAEQGLSVTLQPLTHIESNYEESAGELWGWQESSPGGVQIKPQFPTLSSSASSDSLSASGRAGATGLNNNLLPSAASSLSAGPSRYGSHFHRQSSFAQLPSSANAVEHSMEEWMEINADEERGGEDDQPSKQPTAEELLSATVSLASDPHTTYLLLTSRSRDWCDSLFRSVPNPPPNLWFAAENGYFFKHGPVRGKSSQTPINPATSPSVPSASSSNATSPSSSLSSPSSDWHVMYENVDFSWMEGVFRVMNYFCERTPRSFIQAQETSMQWHYGDAERVFAKRQALDLISHLTGGPLSNTATEVLDSANIVQVRPLAVSKGRALKHLLTYLHKRYKKEQRQQSSKQKAQTIASDSDEESGEQRGGVAASPGGGDGEAQEEALFNRSGLNPAAIQSALAESGILIQSEGEPSGYEEDDEADDRQQRTTPRGGNAAQSVASPSSSASASSRPHSLRSSLEIRSRRPSLVDPSDAPEGWSSTNTTADAGQSRPISSHLTAWSPMGSAAPSSSSSSASSFSSQVYVPLDFVLCIGSFLERDEDIFPLLNEWADTGTLPAGLLSQSQTAAAAQHLTPSFHHRRISLGGSSLPSQSPTASATQPIPQSIHPSGSRKVFTADLSGLGMGAPSSSAAPAQSPTLHIQPLQQTFTSPLSMTSLSDALSPSSDAGPASSSSSLSIWTVTVGNKPSRARFALPDLAAVNTLIVQLAASQRQSSGTNIASASAASSSWLDSKPSPVAAASQEIDDKERETRDAVGGKLQGGEPTMHS